ncbi:MAG TPA: T9SS type A sorting domain-containing protein [bacterium]|nr:T9SS type A sorting domain-containing protein [bacterium]
MHLSPLGKPTANTKNFYIREDLQAIKPAFESMTFERYDTSRSEVTFFIEQSELTRIGEVTIQNLLTKLKDRMFNSTPNGLYNPAQGFFRNEVELFGEPPDVDGNDSVYVLLLDIQDTYDPEAGGNYVAGYFDPLDQLDPDEDPDQASKNEADILYIDTDPGLSQDFEQTITTAAHELQHLLHFGADPSEDIWVNEGMSEVTAHLFGLQARSFSNFLSNPTRTLTHFDYEAEDVIADYAKVGLWTLYLYAQYGAGLLQQIVQTGGPGGQGVSGLDRAFSQAGNVFLTFDQVFTNWLIANVGHTYLPEGAPEYHYGEFNIPSVEPALTISQFPTIDRGSVIKNYAGSYVRLYDGMISDAVISPPLSNGEDPLLDMNAALLLSDGNEYDIVMKNNVSGTGPDFSKYTRYDNAWMILFNQQEPAETLSGNYTLSIFGSGGQVVETLDYSSGETVNTYLPLEGGTAATVFDLPNLNTQVLQAEVKLFNNKPVSFKLRESLGGVVLDSVRLGKPSQGWISWQPEPVGEGLTQLSLQVTSDSNGVAADSLIPEMNKSFYRQSGDNTEFSQLFVRYPTSRTVEANWKMRLQIAYPDTGSQIKDSYAWRHNPWIMSSEKHGNTISLILVFQDPGDVRVDVFNILGRHVKRIYDSPVTEPNRPFSVLWNGTNKYSKRVSSGMYLFRVQKGMQQEVRKLTIIW